MPGIHWYPLICYIFAGYAAMAKINFDFRVFYSPNEESPTAIRRLSELMDRPIKCPESNGIIHFVIPWLVTSCHDWALRWQTIVQYRTQANEKWRRNERQEQAPQRRGRSALVVTGHM